MKAHIWTIIGVAIFALAACGSPEGYPDMGEVPEVPEPSLTPERSQEVTEEIQAARDEAVRVSSEGRDNTSTDDDVSEPEGEDD